MKAILEFTLPEDREDFETYQKAWDYKIALKDFYEESLRRRIKYDCPETDIETLLKNLKSEYIQLTSELNL